jgi:hypothetical protein
MTGVQIYFPNYAKCTKNLSRYAKCTNTSAKVCQVYKDDFQGIADVQIYLPRYGTNIFCPKTPGGHPVLYLIHYRVTHWQTAGGNIKVS